nr:glycosyltransferase [uncultured Erwinia sp.]
MFNTTLFIDESPVYGGHEEMFLRLIAQSECPADQKITIIANKKNQKLIDEIDSLKARTGLPIAVVTHEFSGFPVRPLTNLLAWRDAFALYRLIRSGGFTQVMVVQGTIEIGGLSLLVARLSGCKVLSYIPITKRSRLLGVTLGGFRDWLNRLFYYPLAHKFITISEFNKRELVADFAVPEEKISLVYNFNEPTFSMRPSVSPVQLPDGINFLLIGRVDFLQKRQQEFLRAFAAQQTHRDLYLHIVGDNSSAESERLRAEFAGNPNIVFHGWCAPERIEALMQAADGIVLPSRFEGVPLVMVEAVKLGRVVFGSDVDGMKEFLPPQWRFPADDLPQAIAMMASVSEHQSENARLIQTTQEKFNQTFNPQRSSSAFNAALGMKMVPKILLDCRLMTARPTGISRYSEKFLAYYIEKYGVDNVTALVNEARPDVACRQQVIALRAFNLLHWMRFPGWLKQQDYTHYISFHYSGLMRPVNGIKSAVTVHDLMFELVPEFFSGWLKKLIGKRYFRLLVGKSMAASDLVLSVSATTRDDVRALYQLDSAVTGEGLFLTAQPDSGIIHSLGLQDKGYLLYTGNNRPHKNIPALLAAFAELRKTQPGLSLVLVGHTAASQQEGVIYPGFVSDEQLVALYQHARAFVFPSLYEGFGLPIIEALANGCPVIASDIPAFREFANDNIRYFELGNHAALVALMQEKPLFYPDQADVILQKFSWKSTWQKLDRILDKWL